jgi:hypothetical protein
MLPELSDAKHLFQAIGNGLDDFLTTDKRTILSRADE